MGKYDSTKTRVTPLFDFIGLDIEKINRLLSLINPEIEIRSKIINTNYGKNEKAIPPSPSLLKWCILNFDKLNQEINEKYHEKSPNTYEKRKKLFSGEIEMKNKAIKLIKKNPNIQKKWYIFEGYTHPDILIETKDTYIVGEAKRTERKLTEKTEWLDPRDQLIRHVDALIDNTTKRIISLFLIDKKMESKYNMNRYYNKEYFEKSLPHRKKEKIESIYETYIGYTFWNVIQSEFDIEFPNTKTGV